MTVFLIALFSWYLPMVFFMYYIFDILGVKKIYSLIPIFNVCILLGEYQGRVWKNNWGMLYIIMLILPIMVYFGPFIIMIVMIMFNVFVLLLVALIVIAYGLTFLVIYLPLLRSEFSKFILMFNTVLLLTWYVNLTYTITFFAFFNYFYVFVAFDNWKKVKSGKYVVYEKLDYSKLSSSDIKMELMLRGSELIHSVDEVKHNS